MCWRDDVVQERYCTTCGHTYYGDFGHRGCPGRPKPAAGKQPEPKKPKPQEVEPPPF